MFFLDSVFVCLFVCSENIFLDVTTNNRKVKLSWMRPHIFTRSQTDIKYWIEIYNPDCRIRISKKITGLADENGYLIRNQIFRHFFFSVEKTGLYFARVRIVLMEELDSYTSGVELYTSPRERTTRIEITVDEQIEDEDWGNLDLF